MAGRTYIISDGIITIKLGASTSLHACRNFLRRLGKCKQEAGPVLYVRTGLRGCIEDCEVWYFSFQFTKEYPHKFSDQLLEQHEEPKFIHGGVNRKMKKTRPPKNSQERHRKKLREKGLCAICGKEKDPEFVHCLSCRFVKNIAAKNKRRKIKRKQELESFRKQYENKAKSDPKQSEVIQKRKEQEKEFQPPLGDPTQHKPGSDGKIAVICERYNRGLSFWNPEDEITQMNETERKDMIDYTTPK